MRGFIIDLGIKLISLKSIPNAAAYNIDWGLYVPEKEKKPQRMHMRL